MKISRQKLEHDYFSVPTYAKLISNSQRSLPSADTAGIFDPIRYLHHQRLRSLAHQIPNLNPDSSPKDDIRRDGRVQVTDLQ